MSGKSAEATNLLLQKWCTNKVQQKPQFLLKNLIKTVSYRAT
jgi:hypothetical protein